VNGRIGRRTWLIVVALVAAAAAILLLMGRPAICSCGTVKLWVGTAKGPDNSQHLSDWYTLSHIIHGFLFCGLTWLALGRRGPGLRLMAAVLLEAGWEIIENSPFVIERYRHATMALGYSGDTVINSVSDISAMILGFVIARRLPVWATIAVALGFELLALAVIRDNLSLNVLMLVAPSDAIRAWQAAG
jgi:hypothetical protein